MSKRKSATTTKHARNSKGAAQRAKQAIVRSPKDSRPLSAAAGSTELPSERHYDSKREAPLVEDPAKAVVGNPATAVQEHYKQMMRDVDSKQGSAFSSTTANVRAYQAKLLELTQANMQIGFEFAAKLAAIRSPVDIFGVIVELTSKRMAIFQKISIEMAELATKR